MQDTKEIEEVKKSYQRCYYSKGFFDTFYEIFLASSEKIPVFFANTDFEKQKEMLAHSLTMMLLYAEKGDEAGLFIQNLGKKHGKDGLKIKAQFYDLWLDSLVLSIKKHDPEYSDELELQWRKAVSGGVEIMKSYS